VFGSLSVVNALQHSHQADVADVATLVLRCSLQVLAQQGRARTATMKLPHYTAETPMFMPVGTQGKKLPRCSSCLQF
jgi:hypothetical protein